MRVRVCTLQHASNIIFPGQPLWMSIVHKLSNFASQQDDTLWIDVLKQIPACFAFPGYAKKAPQISVYCAFSPGMILYVSIISACGQPWQFHLSQCSFAKRCSNHILA